MTVFRKIAGTVGARLMNAMLSFAVLIIATRSLGAEGYGTVTMVVLGITIIQLVSNIIGGSALVFLVPREDVFRLFILSYVWAFIVAALGANLLAIFSLIPPEYRRDTLLLSLLASFNTVNLMILLGKEKIRTYNLLTILQVGLTLLSLVIFLGWQKHKHPDYYIYSLYAAYTVVYVAGMIAIRPHLMFSDLNELGKPLKKIMHFGGLMQLASIIQFFNYRLSYYLVERFFDKSMLGKYSVGVQLAEGMWIVAKSVALVQYARISNEPDNTGYAKRITLIFLKFTYLATAILLTILLIIPSQTFVLFFGSDFIHVKLVILSLSPGILCVAASQIISHYFSGIGKPQYNTMSSGVGFVVVLAAGLMLIPALGLVGAGLASSFSYLAILCYQLYWFGKISGASALEMLISLEDVRKIVAEIRGMLRSQD
ncbi:MAG: oligosaccharide flippase family protein [Bacteroidales bacterium]|nr:oligosaccharide flippase family protein [Bacteroidales bacterium]MDZ4203289.1 oligosaccharide flippase family protein [Bacteroidales bacterium]